MWSKLESQEPETLDPEDRAWLFTYVEDMLYLMREGRTQTLALDLGWYPDGDPQGAYRLEAILDGNWEEPLLSLTTRSTQEVTEAAPQPAVTRGTPQSLQAQNRPVPSA